MRMTFGAELELADVRKDRSLPPHLGWWDWAETDIINTREPYRAIAADPLGEVPPVGGEVNLQPSKSPSELAERAEELLSWFRSQGDEPGLSPVSHFHVHVRVEGLRGDIHLLKSVIRGIHFDQDRILTHISGFVDDPRMGERPTIRNYLKWDGARRMPVWMIENIIEKAKNFDDFIRLHACGKDGVSRGRPFRYGINTYSMKHIDTIEFRMFRPTLDPSRMLDCIRFAEDWIRSCFDGGRVDLENYQFPEFIYDHELVLGWCDTKYPTNRGRKERTLVQL